jgi:hypothetical protein
MGGSWCFGYQQSYTRERDIRALLEEALKIADITRLEVHAPDSELEKLREPLSGLNPMFFCTGRWIPALRSQFTLARQCFA